RVAFGGAHLQHRLHRRRRSPGRRARALLHRAAAPGSDARRGAAHGGRGPVVLGEELLMKTASLLSCTALALFDALVGVGGCQSIAGVEERTLDEQAQLCREYCDVVMVNCTEDNAVYQTDEQCMAVCASLEQGSTLEPTGNTAACRLNRAENATREPQNQCRLAGPGG